MSKNYHPDFPSYKIIHSSNDRIVQFYCPKCNQYGHEWTEYDFESTLADTIVDLTTTSCSTFNSLCGICEVHVPISIGHSVNSIEELEAIMISEFSLVLKSTIELIRNKCQSIIYV